MFGPRRTGSAASSHKVCVEGGKKGEFQRKEIAPSKKKKLGEFVSIHPTSTWREESAHFSYFLAIKAIVFIEIQGRFGSALMATEILWRTRSSRWNLREVALGLSSCSGTAPWPALSISGSLHFLLLAPKQDFPSLPRSSSLPAERFWSKGHLDFVKRNLGLFGETSGWGSEFWRIKDEPTDTEGKENHGRESKSCRKWH